MSKNKKLSLTIGWLYPELMSTYGDRGNIIVLQKRCEWRNIDVKIERISIETSESRIATCDLLFMGGAQDTQQEIVNKDLFNVKGKVLREKILEGTPGLYICGAYQFLGRYYKTADRTELPGLGIFPMFTENPGDYSPRLIGNIVIEPTSNLRLATSSIVGFENHGGRTYLEDDSMAFAKVVKGFGNNGEDKTEGIIFKNSIGSYLHGPILPKNPEIADWLIKKALEKKSGEETNLEKLDDFLENEAKEVIWSKLKT
jgi:lipid II isoglutaminyl synthase (glutamine-hydrolysing)